MRIGIKRCGKGAGIPLSKAMRKHLNADLGDQVEVRIISEGLLIKSIHAPQYTLRELLSSCSPELVKLDIEDILWLKNSPTGKEI